MAPSRNNIILIITDCYVRITVLDHLNICKTVGVQTWDTQILLSTLLAITSLVCYMISKHAESCLGLTAREFEVRRIVDLGCLCTLLLFDCAASHPPL
jgi:hypothetical protein